MVTSDIRRLYAESDALDLADLVRRRQVLPAELVETAIEAIEDWNPQLNAVVLKTYEIARRDAAHPKPGPFSGVPFLLKNIGSMWKGTPLTNGFGYLNDFVCDHDTAMVERIQAAGFLLLGRTNTPEGGWSLGTEPRFYGAARNPWNSEITPGGSSGGAAAAVAARIVPLAEASDGGGSIRAPASCCGLVGLKPSRGRISYGPKVTDLWQGSVATLCVTRTVRDTAAYLDAVAINLPGDPYPAPRPTSSWLDQIAGGPGRLRIGYTLKPAWGDGLAPGVMETLLQTLRLLEGLGHDLEEHDLGVDLRPVWADYNKINAAESAADFERQAAILGRPIEQAEIMPVNWALIERGRALSAVSLTQAIASIRNAGQRIAADIAPYDVFLTPTLSQTPRPIGYWSMEEPDLDTYLDRWSDGGYLFACNISGLPAMSLPVGMIGGDTPVGMHIVGRYGDETTLLRLAQQMETELQWQKRRPASSLGGA